MSDDYYTAVAATPSVTANTLTGCCGIRHLCRLGHTSCGGGLTNYTKAQLTKRVQAEIEEMRTNCGSAASYLLAAINGQQNRGVPGDVLRGIEGSQLLAGDLYHHGHGHKLFIYLIPAFKGKAEAKKLGMAAQERHHAEMRKSFSAGSSARRRRLG